MGYALETMADILNSVPTKYVPNTLVELWATILFYNTTEYEGVWRMFLRERLRSWKLSQNYAIS